MSTLSGAVTAQASLLATHQFQLSRLTSVTEELLRAVQSLKKSAVASSPASASPAPAHDSEPLTIESTSPHLAFPEKFTGDPGKCKDFGGLLVNKGHL